MMATSSGTVKAPAHSSQPGSFEQAVASMIPDNISESDVEKLVQTITDQIMLASV